MAHYRHRTRWFLVRWVLFVLIVGAVLTVCFIVQQLDGIVHQKVLEIVRDKFNAAEVFIASTHVLEGEGIELSRFLVLGKNAPEDSTNYPAVLEANRVLLECPTQIHELAQDTVIQRILFDGATIRTFRRPDGSWSLGALKPNPQAAFSSKAAPIQFRNTTLELHDMTDATTERKLILRNVTMTIAPMRQGDGGAFFPFEGRADCEFSRNITFSGKYFPQEAKIYVDGEVEALLFSKDFLHRLPREIAERMSALERLVGRVTTQVGIRASLKDFSGAQFFLKGKLTEGQAEDPRLQQPITDISTDFQIGNDGFEFPNLSLKYGQGTSVLAMTQWGYGPTAPRRILADLNQISLVEGIELEALGNTRNILRQIHPTGEIDMDGEFFFDGHFWKATGRIASENLGVRHDGFPYRVDGLRGEVTLGGDSVTFQFRTANDRIVLDGNFPLASKQNPTPNRPGVLNVQARAISVDERLLKACPGETEDFLRALEPGGAINVSVTQHFTLGDQPHRDCQITVELLKNTIRYRSFPYPLRDIEGTITLVNGRLLAKNLRGTNNQAGVTLSCEATLPLEEGVKPELNLFITGAGVILDEEFYQHLPPNVSQLFNSIRPQGAVHVQYHYQTAQGKEPTLEIAVDTPPAGIAVTLPDFAYRFEQFQGQFRYTNGRITLPSFKARHGDSRVSGKLTGTVTSTRQWTCRLENLFLDSVVLDRELLRILPESMRMSLASARPEGMLHYRGTLDVHYDSAQPHPFTTAWKGEIGLTRAMFDLGITLTNVNGGIFLQGSWDGESLNSTGELYLDSLFYRNVQFTEVRGPIRLDNAGVLLGELSSGVLSTKQSSTPEPIGSRRLLSAKTLGGELLGNFLLRFGTPSTFHVRAVLTRGKLEACSSLVGAETLKGNLTLSLNLQGTVSSLYSLHGSGEMHMNDADVYQLSVMMSLLKIFSLKEIDQTGFSSGNARFRIDGQHIYFDQLDFYGDAFSLFGKGEMNFRKQVQLVFYSTIGRGESKIPVIGPLMHVTGRQMMLITMKGPLQNPEIEQQPLPGLNRTIQQIEADFHSPVGSRAGENP